MVTDQQVRRLFKLMHTETTQAVAAAKAGMAEKTARKYLQAGRLPSELKKERTWRTRPDAFTDHWDEVRDHRCVRRSGGTTVAPAAATTGQEKRGYREQQDDVAETAALSGP